MITQTPIQWPENSDPNQRQRVCKYIYDYIDKKTHEWPRPDSSIVYVFIPNPPPTQLPTKQWQAELDDNTKVSESDDNNQTPDKLVELSWGKHGKALMVPTRNCYEHLIRNLFELRSDNLAIVAVQLKNESSRTYESVVSVIEALMNKENPDDNIASNYCGMLFDWGELVEEF